jgi:hypothetical protein
MGLLIHIWFGGRLGLGRSMGEALGVEFIGGLEDGVAAGNALVDQAVVHVVAPTRSGRVISTIRLLR